MSEGGCTGREAPERARPWTWQRDEISLQARARRKPSGGCENPRTEQAKGWDLSQKVAAHGWSREEGMNLGEVKLGPKGEPSEETRRRNSDEE